MWGFFLSTALVYHVTFCVNSVTHIIGNKRFKNKDESRNNWWVAMLTFGEGWHNNHHAWPQSARLGHEPWQLDPGFMCISALAKLKLVWSVKVAPTMENVKGARRANGEDRASI